jgi:hypothetical protein
VRNGLADQIGRDRHPYGMSMVGRLRRQVNGRWYGCRSSIEMSPSQRKFDPYAGPYGESILIPPELTHGVWIEFFQK